MIVPETPEMFLVRKYSIGNLNENHIIFPGNTEREEKEALGDRGKELRKLQTSNSTRSGVMQYTYVQQHLTSFTLNYDKCY